MVNLAVGYVVGEGQQDIAILGQSVHVLGVLGLEALEGEIEGPLRLLSGLGHPNLVELGLDLGLNGLRKLVKDIGGFVHPATLLYCVHIELAKSLQKPKAPSPTASSGPSGAYAREAR